MTMISTLETPIRFFWIMIFFMTTLAISQGQVQAQQNGKCLSILEIKERLKTTNDAQTADAISKRGICFQVDDNVMNDINPPAETGKQLQQLRNTVRVYDDLKLELKKCSLEGGSSIECQFAVTNMGTGNDRISAYLASNQETYASDSNSNRAALGGILGSNLSSYEFEVISETTYNLRLKFDFFDRKAMEINLLSLRLYNIYKYFGSQRRGVSDTIITWKKIPVKRSNVQAQQNGKCLSILEIKERLKTTNDAQTADAISKQGICFQVDDNVINDIDPPAETGKQLQQLRNTVRVHDDLKFELKKCAPEGASSIECQFAVTNMGTGNDRISAYLASNQETYASDSNSNRAALGGILGSNLSSYEFEVISETTYNLRLKFDGFDRKAMEINLLSLRLYNIYKYSGSQRRGASDTVLIWKTIPVTRP